jgi:hypothetical protein
MKSTAFILFFFLLLFGLPVTGAWVAGHNVQAYLEFPPRAQHVGHAPFSWPVFIVLSMVIMMFLLPLLVRIGGAFRRTAQAEGPTRPFPWWGWISLTLCGHFWILAWSRQDWFVPMQLHTFPPLWICFIVTINALTWRRTGRCLMMHRTRYFLWLFPASAVFWWFFEYLNRFVQNWNYIACERFSALHYFLLASLSFSTVLPAVLSTEEWLASYPRSTAGLERFVPLQIESSRPVAWSMLACSAAGLFLISWFPDWLFPLLWVAPLFLLVSANTLRGGEPFFPGLRSGNWRRVLRFMLAALICGFFWELWNWHSLAKWVYSVPYVDRFHLFEMPILGYSGYLPFGLQCAAAAEMVRRSAPIVHGRG